MKALLIIACILVIIGSALLIVTVCSDGFGSGSMLCGNFEERTVDLTEEFVGVEILSDTANVSLFPSESADCKVVYNDNKKINYSIAVEDGILKIKTVDTRAWFERIFSFSFKEASLTVYLPQNDYTSLLIDESTGDVFIHSCFKFNTIDVKVSTGDVMSSAAGAEHIKIQGGTGDVTLDGVNAGSLDVEISTGCIRLNSVVASGDVNVKVSTGDILISNMGCNNFTSHGDTGNILIDRANVSGNAAVERSTGDVIINGTVCSGNISTVTTTGKTELNGITCECDINIAISTGKCGLFDVTCAGLTTTGDTGSIIMSNVIANGNLSIERGTGDVTFDACDASVVKIVTDTGDVEGSLLTDKIFSTKTSTGKIDIPESNGDGRCNVETSTGNIKIEIETH